MKTLSDYITEAAKMPKRLPEAPMQFVDFQKAGNFIAKKLKCGIESYERKLQVWAEKQRNEYLATIWHSCLREVKPQGFDEKMVDIAISSNLASFFANEVRVNELTPPKWRRAVCDWIISAFKKNEAKWVESRFNFTEKNGTKYVSKKW